MLKTIFVFLMPIFVGASGTLDVEAYAFLQWVAALAFVVFLTNQLFDFWRKNLKAAPASADVARDLGHVSETINAGLKRIEGSFERQIEKLEANMNERFKAAYQSRSAIHKELDGIRERLATTEAELAIYRQQKALNDLAGKKS